MKLRLILAPMARRHRSLELRRAVLGCFSRPPSSIVERFAGFDEELWQLNLRWLDTSGLALYLLDHLASLGQEHLLPYSIYARLRSHLADNTLRNAELLAEAIDANRDFQRQEVLFANLKGITLTPDSVPDAALRYQLDLDFLVRAEDAPRATRALEDRGYYLACVSGDSWEFKTRTARTADIKDLYKAKPQRSAELHLTPAEGVLERVQIRSFAGVAFPVLSPVDLFIAQARHLFKHLAESFTRAAWLLEFRRHMVTRHSDANFWQQLQDRLVDAPMIPLALGVATLLAVEVFGDEPPALLLKQINVSVPASVQLWIRLYGCSALIADFPGTKLHLLLERELTQTGYTPHGSLLPRRGPRINRNVEVERGSLDALVHRIQQLLFLTSRTRFHFVEGARYLVEASRFRRLLLEDVQ